LFRQPVKTAAGLRMLRLLEFAVVMLRRRAIELYVLATGVLPVGAVDGGAAVAHLGGSPIFPDTRGGWRDPANTRRSLRNARGTEELAWVTSHVYRKTAATMLDEAGLTVRQIVNQMGHSRVSLT
jgi:integrase